LFFGNPEKNDVVLKRKYDEVKRDFISKLESFKKNYPTPKDVANLKSEEDKVEFVKAFRDLLKLKSSLNLYITILGVLSS
jgi:type I restriction enzyme R subunit